MLTVVFDNGNNFHCRVEFLSGVADAVCAVVGYCIYIKTELVMSFSHFGQSVMAVAESCVAVKISFVLIPCVEINRSIGVCDCVVGVCCGKCEGRTRQKQCCRKHNRESFFEFLHFFTSDFLLYLYCIITKDEKIVNTKQKK